MADGAKNDMVLDRVDHSDDVIGTIRRGDVFNERAGFRVVHVFIFDGQGRLLLQRLSQRKERHPGLWGSSAAGFVKAGEAYGEAARRKTQSELGLDGAVLRPLTKMRMHDAGCTKFIQLYKAEADGPFATDPNEVAEVRFERVDRILQDLHAHPERFTPTFTRVFESHMKSSDAI